MAEQGIPGPGQSGYDHPQLVIRDPRGRYLPIQILGFQEGGAGDIVVVGPSNPIPSRPVGEYFFSTSVATLNDGEEIDSGWYDMSEVGKYQLEILGSSVGLSVTQESSSDPDGAGVFRTTTFIADSTFVLANFPARQRYMRTRIINNTGGPVTDACLAIKVQYGSADQHSVFPLSIDPQPFSQAALVQSVGKGQQPDGTFETTPADGHAVHMVTPLIADESVESPWISSAGWRGVELFIVTDQLSAVDGIEFEVTDEPTATTPIVRWTQRISFAAADLAHGRILIRFGTSLEGFRVRYTNGSTPQGSFFLHVHLKVSSAQDPVQLLESSIVPTSVAATTRSVIAGKAPGSGLYENVVINDGQALLVAPFLTEVGLKRIPGYDPFSKFGRTAILGNGDTEDVWTTGGDYTGQPMAAPEILELVSGSDQDAAGGTGMLTARIFGLKSSASTEIESEDVVLTGLVPALTINTWWRVFRMNGLTYGDGAGNVGIITCRGNVTPLNVFGEMPVGLGGTQVAAFTVPAEKTGFIQSFYAILARTSGAAGSASVALMMRELGQGSYRAVRFYEITTASPAQPVIRFPIEIPAGADIKVRAIEISDVGSTMTAEMDVVFRDFNV